MKTKVPFAALVAALLVVGLAGPASTQEPTYDIELSLAGTSVSIPDTTSQADDPYTVSNDGPFGLLSGVNGFLYNNNSPTDSRGLMLDYSVALIFASGNFIVTDPFYDWTASSVFSIAAGSAQQVNILGLGLVSECHGKPPCDTPQFSVYSVTITQD